MLIAPTLAARAAELPHVPGVYLFKDEAGVVLYVGKAKDLRTRVRQYLSGTDQRFMVRFLVEAAQDVEVMTVNTDKEALLLENTLIKKHQPRYNTKLVDDANFLSLRIDPSAAWPDYELVRRITPSRHRYFGPFASASRARQTLDFVHRSFPLRTCSDQEMRARTRPCLLHQMRRCLAPCVGLCTQGEYDEVLEQSMLFLRGQRGELLERLRVRMAEAAESESFEEAARLRDLLRSLEATLEKQHVADRRLADRDVWGLFRAGRKGTVAIVPMRRGFLEEPVMLPVDDAVGDDAELFSTWVHDWYAGGRDIPTEVLVPLELPDADALADVLSERKGAKVDVAWPQRGDKVRLLTLALDNAKAAHDRRDSADARTERALEELARVCHLRSPPSRIECFDNSNLQGTDPVASMVVFLEGKPARAEYRRYKVKTVVGADDYATMREILGRRLKRGLGENSLPDLLVVDGGKGQLNAALHVLRELGLPELPVIGFAKPKTERRKGDREAEDKVVLPGAKNLIRLRGNSLALRLLQHLRDESHDTAIRYHRKVRGKRSLTSVLDGIEGVGPARRKALLRAFGSVAGVQAASVEAIAAVPGIGPALAERVRQALSSGAEPLPD